MVSVPVWKSWVYFRLSPILLLSMTIEIVSPCRISAGFSFSSAEWIKWFFGTIIIIIHREAKSFSYAHNCVFGPYYSNPEPFTYCVNLNNTGQFCNSTHDRTLYRLANMNIKPHAFEKFRKSCEALWLFVIRRLDKTHWK